MKNSRFDIMITEKKNSLVFSDKYILLVRDVSDDSSSSVVLSVMK